MNFYTRYINGETKTVYDDIRISEELIELNYLITYNKYARRN